MKYTPSQRRVQWLEITEAFIPIILGGHDLQVAEIIARCPTLTTSLYVHVWTEQFTHLYNRDPNLSLWSTTVRFVS